MTILQELLTEKIHDHKNLAVDPKILRRYVVTIKVLVGKSDEWVFKNHVNARTVAEAEGAAKKALYISAKNLNRLGYKVDSTQVEIASRDIFFKAK